MEANQSGVHQPRNDLIEYFRKQPVSHDKTVTEYRVEVADRQRRNRKVVKTQKWTHRGLLGEGSWGKVILQRNEETGDTRALKKIKINRRNGADQYRYQLGELLAMATLSNRYEINFVRFDGWFDHKEKIYIAMQYFERRDLETCVRDRRPLPEVEVKQIVFQVAESLSLMHKHDFTHRDIKADNVFVEEVGPDWWVKLGDFSIAKRIQSGDSTILDSSIRGSHSAPETWDGIEYPKFSADIFSLGHLTCWLLTSQQAFNELAFVSYGMRKVPFREQVLRAEGVTPEGIEFVKSCVSLDPDKRPQARNISHERWLHDVAIEYAESSEQVPMSSIRHIRSVEEQATPLAAKLPGDPMPLEGPSVIPPEKPVPSKLSLSKFYAALQKSYSREIIELQNEDFKSLSSPQNASNGHVFLDWGMTRQYFAYKIVPLNYSQKTHLRSELIWDRVSISLIQLLMSTEVYEFETTNGPSVSGVPETEYHCLDGSLKKHVKGLLARTQIFEEQQYVTWDFVRLIYRSVRVEHGETTEPCLKLLLRRRIRTAKSYAAYEDALLSFLHSEDLPAAKAHHIFGPGAKPAPFSLWSLS